jgi:hypothetical protein
MGGWKTEATPAALTPAAILVTLERDLLLSSLSRPAGSPPPLQPASLPPKAAHSCRAAADVVNPLHPLHPLHSEP